MSQRFGRNQRRRAREAITALQAAHTLDRELAKYLSDTLSDVREELQRTKDVAVNMSILFPAEQMQVRWDSTDLRPIRIEKRQNLLGSTSVLTAASAAQTMQILSLEVLVARIKPDKFSECLHADVTFGDGVWGYGITRSAWQALNNGQRQHFIQRTVARQLVQQIAKHNFR